MKNFKKFRNSQERRTEIDERISEVEVEIANAKANILGNVLPMQVLKKVGRNVKPMPVKVGAQLLATRIVSNSHPLIKVATPFLTNSLLDKASELESQKLVLSRAHSFFSWLAAKTKLSLKEEEQLLSSEIKDIKLPSVDASELTNLDELEEKLYHKTTLDAEKVDFY